MSDQFDPSCFILVTMVVNALCWSRFESTGVLVTSIPACCAALMSTSVDRSASGESLNRKRSRLKRPSST